MARWAFDKNVFAFRAPKSRGTRALFWAGLSVSLLIWTAAVLLPAASAVSRGENAGTDRLGEMVHDGRSRSYLVHLPKSYNAKKKYPLVLILHGGGGNARLTAQMTGFSATADREGFIAVYPDGTGLIEGLFLTWNAGNCCGFALDEETDDTGFLRALLQRLKKEHAVDPNRVFVTGFSNGGMMSYRLACELSGAIAAIAPVAGAMNVECKPERPLSVVIFHGTEDGHVRYDGGEPLALADWHDRTDRPVKETVAFWVKFNGCRPQAQTSVKGHVQMERYSGCREGTEVVLYTIRGEGHSWPGGRRWAPWAAVPTREISATDLIWEFFTGHPRKD